MVAVLITSGPTREYLDPVRYLSNRSSGRLGAALAAAAQECGDSVVVVSGPVEIQYSPGATVVAVTTTEQMLDATQTAFEAADVLIAAAAPCDYRPELVSPVKLAKSRTLPAIRLRETPDILATLAKVKGNRLVVGFSLETDHPYENAMRKLRTKSCDFMVLNGPETMDSEEISAEVFSWREETVLRFAGPKAQFAAALMDLIHTHLAKASLG